MKKIKFKPIEQNEGFKVLTANAKIGEEMPNHWSDKPAFLMIESGEVLFNLDKESHLLQSSCSIAIPANAQHSFTVLEESLVTLILDAHAKIRFVKNE